MSITHELNDLLTRSNKEILQPPSAKKGAKLVNGIIAGVFFAVMILVGTGNPWLSLNFGFGMFLVIGEILRFDDSAIGLTSGGNNGVGHDICAMLMTSFHSMNHNGLYSQLLD